MSRVSNSLKSISVAGIGYAARMLAQFLSRSVFIYVLGEEYLGFSGLFSNLLYLLNVAEFGIGAGFLYSMYKPMQENDRETLKSLMALYRKAYFAVGCFVGVASLAFTPFLHLVVKEVPDVPHFTLIYLFYAANSTLSYFFTYKSTIITAAQKEYIVSGYATACNLLMHLTQMIALLVTRNYFLYLFLMLACTLLEKYLLARKADKLYPFLKEKDVKPLEKQYLSGILDNMKALVFARVGAVVVNGTLNILISKLFGLIQAGLYANYSLITESLRTVSNMVYNSIAPSVGNMNVTEAPESKMAIFHRIQFFTQWLFGFCAICLMCLLNPFITLWLGEEWLFSLETVAFICLNFYLDGMYMPSTVCRSAMGLHIYMRYMPVLQAVLNIALSILFSRSLGVAGIFLGRAASFLLTSFWSEPVVMYRRVFCHTPLAYFSRYISATALTLVTGGLCWWLCAIAPFSGILRFLVQMCICAIVPNAVFLLVYYRHPDFQYFRQLALSIAGKVLHRKKA